MCRVNTNRRLMTVLVALFVLFALSATAAESDSPGLANESIVELFTSHGCSSCPPADRLLGELLDEHPDLVALEFHVDYWDQLVHGADGNWVDPFSSPEYTLRQRYYNAVALEGRRGVYTPQMIVNGRYAAVGSDAKRVKRQLLRDSAPDQVKIRFESIPPVAIVDIHNESAGQADIWLVSYKDKAETDITAGENRHRTIVNHHIVTSFERLGELESGNNRIEFSVPTSKGQGCAILVQSKNLDRLYGAARCPS